MCNPCYFSKNSVYRWGLLFSRTVKLETRSRAQHLHHNNIFLNFWTVFCGSGLAVMLRSQARAMAIAIAQFPKRKYANKDEFCISRRGGPPFFRSPTIEITETWDRSRSQSFYFENQPAVFSSLPLSFLVYWGNCRLYQTCFRGIYDMFQSSVICSSVFLFSKLLGKLICVDTLALHLS